MMDRILFYKVNDPYGILSNFYKCGFFAESVYWPTVEHYFQSHKFHDKTLREKIRNLSSPMDVAKIGRDRSHPLRDDWEIIKDDIMRLAVFERFKQNENAKNILLSTGGAQLIEHTKNDSYWADGGDGSGKNMLGIILMETRDLLR
nr:NADAR family protein [Serratia fonticola]